MRLRVVLALAIVGCGAAKPAPIKPVAPATPAPRMLDAAQAKAALERGEAANDDDRSADAISDLEHALATFEAGSDVALHLRALAALGEAHRDLGHWEVSEQFERRRLALAQRDGDDSDVAAALAGVARTLTESGRPGAAVPLYKRALAIDNDAGLDENDRNTRNRMNNLALAYGDLGDYELAIELLERVLAVEDVEEPGTLGTATTLHNLALELRDNGDYARAKEMFGRALQIKITELGSRNPQLAPTLNGLAGTLQMLEDYDKAARLYRDVIAITTGMETPGRAIAMSELATIETVQKHYPEAQRHFDDALALLRKIYPDPDGHAEIIRVLIKRTAADLGQRDIRAAERDTGAVLVMVGRVEQSDPAHFVDWLADNWADAGHTQRAAELRSRAKVLRGKP